MEPGKLLEEGPVAASAPGEQDEAKGKTREKDDVIDVDALAASCSRTASSGIRDAALIWTLYGAGLRVSEALALLPADVDLDAREVYVRRGKGGHERRVGLLPAAVPWIERWIRKRGELRVGRTRPMFCAIAKGKIGKEVSR